MEEFPVTWYLFGFMREDSTRKVWLKINPFESEYLMYDFSAGEGDSVQVGMYEFPATLILDSITGVDINETERQKYWFTCVEQPDYQETWVEGIGSDKGIVWSGSAFLVGGFYRLLCLSINGELIYMNPDYEGCYIKTVGINEHKTGSVEFYPVPARDRLFIKVPGNVHIQTIIITDMTGIIIKEFNGERTRLDVSALSEGIYLLKVKYKEGVAVEKILIR